MRRASKNRGNWAFGCIRKFFQTKNSPATLSECRRATCKVECPRKMSDPTANWSASASLRVWVRANSISLELCSASHADQLAVGSFILRGHSTLLEARLHSESVGGEFFCLKKLPNAAETPIPPIFCRSPHPAFAGRSLGIAGVNRHLKLP